MHGLRARTLQVNSQAVHSASLILEFPPLLRTFERAQPNDTGAEYWPC